MRINYRVILSVIVVVFLAACENDSVKNSENALSGKLVVTGSSTIAPLASELALNFERLHPSVKIDVQTGGSSRGVTDVRRSISHIGMVSRKLKDSEVDIIGHTLAKDGVSIIVHKENPISSLSSEQVKAIFSGKTNSWQSFNGSGEKITVINKAEGRSTLEVFLHFFKLDNREIKPDIIIGDNEQGIKLVANNKHAIAYVSIGTAEYSAQHGVAIKTVGLNNIEASTANLINGSFPLSRELNFITQDKVSDLAKAFLDYSLSAAAHKTIKEFGFVPFNAP